MKTEIKGNKLVITVDLLDAPKPSSTGSGNLIIASSGGFKKAGAKIKDKEISVNVTALIKP